MSAPSPPDPTLPPGLIRGAAALIAFVMVLVAVARVTGPAGEDVATAPVVVARDLVFVDRPEGGVAVHDASDGRLLEVLAVGADGFVRGVLRSVARERRGFGLGPDTPVRLSSRRDGSIALEDLATGRRIELKAFGATNAAAFARFLPTGPAVAHLSTKD